MLFEADLIFSLQGLVRIKSRSLDLWTCHAMQKRGLQNQRSASTVVSSQKRREAVAPAKPYIGGGSVNRTLFFTINLHKISCFSCLQNLFKNIAFDTVECT